MNKDPIVEEVHRIREESAAKFNYNVRALVRSFQEAQKHSGRKVVRLSPKRIPVVSSARS
ncbi:MAG: hypothetical protein ACOYMV_11335 [Verrucomicrobiia bacterium]